MLPTSLAPTLEGLHVMARGFNEDTRWLQHWGWLQPFSHLNSMRLQVGGRLDIWQATTGWLMLQNLQVLHGAASYAAFLCGPPQCTAEYCAATLRTLPQSPAAHSLPPLRAWG